MWLLQVHQNVSQVEEIVSNRSELGSDRSYQNASRKNESISLVQNQEGRSLTDVHRANSLNGLNAGSLLIDVAVTVLIILLLAVLYRLAFTSSSHEVPRSASKAGAGEPAKVPFLYPAFQTETTADHQFRVDVNAVLDTDTPSFEIKNDKGTTLLTSTLSEGRMMTVKSRHAEGPGVLVRGTSTEANVMLTILKEDGSYFGKVSPGAGGKLIFYHMQKPCVEFKAGDGPFACSAWPLTDPRTQIASTKRIGQQLHVNVMAGYDAVLMLGCLLGIVCLEPTLVKCMQRDGS